jgi:predicted DNA-binding transcriptional regulator AlpA
MSDTNIFDKPFVTFKEMREAGLLPQRQTLRGWINRGKFPAPIEMGPGRGWQIWPSDEIKSLLTNRKKP